MTKVTYNSVEFIITMDGHAGYGPAGQDIVCAGLSTIIQTVHASLKSRGIRYFLDLAEPEGFVSLKAYPKAEQRYPCTVIFDTAAEGFKLLADNYPDYVQYIKEAF